MKRRITTVIGLGGMAVMMLAGCGVSSDSAPKRLDSSFDTAIRVAVSTTLPNIDPVVTTVPSVAPDLRPIVVYLAQGEGVVPRARSLPEPVSPRDVVELLAKGPTENEAAVEMRTLFTSDTQVVEVSDVVDGMVTVNLDPSVLELSGSDQLLLIGQVSLTLTSLTRVSSVQYVVASGPIPVVGPDGVSIDRPVVKSDFSALVFR